MQAPTPPTKPIPPTPPTMKTSSTAVPVPPQTPTTATPSTTTTPTKETPKPTAKEQAQPAPAQESTTKAPPLGSYSHSSNDSKETTAETTLAPTVPTQKSNLASNGFTLFLIITLFIALGAIVMLWFKNNKPKQQPLINYSSESTDDIVNLILSQTPPEPAVQAVPKVPPKSLLLKPAAKPKNKGGFEVRI